MNDLEPDVRLWVEQKVWLDIHNDCPPQAGAILASMPLGIVTLPFYMRQVTLHGQLCVVGIWVWTVLMAWLILKLREQTNHERLFFQYLREAMEHDQLPDLEPELEQARETDCYSDGY